MKIEEYKPSLLPSKERINHYYFFTEWPNFKSHWTKIISEKFPTETTTPMYHPSQKDATFRFLQNTSR